MTKYNPRIKAHRKLLAENIIKACLSCGMIIDFSQGEEQEELVFVKPIDDMKVYVYTSIDSCTKQARQVGHDGIRITAMYADGHAASWPYRYSTNVNRTGHFKRISKRLVKAIRVATWNAENPNSPRWNGLRPLEQKK